jgi:hypothetical protein
VLFPPDHPAKKLVEAAIEKVGREKWGAKWETVRKSSEFKGTCLHDGNEKEKYAGYPGNWFISMRNKSKPTVQRHVGNGVLQDILPEEGVPYAGSYISVLVDLWAQENQWGKRINATVTGVIFLRHGPAFVGGVPASNDAMQSLAAGIPDIEEEDLSDIL